MEPKEVDLITELRLLRLFPWRVLQMRLLLLLLLLLLLFVYPWYLESRGLKAYVLKTAGMITFIVNIIVYGVL